MHKKDIAKKMKNEPGGEGDSLRHLFNEKTGRYNLKMHSRQKGKGSLKSTGKNEGKNMMMGKNGTQRA